MIYTENEPLGEIIKGFRHGNGYTQENMATKMNISKKDYSKIERGLVDIPISQLRTLARIFELTLGELVDWP
jgi:transcriptional regulator with XRE-family HTH domain